MNIKNSEFWYAWLWRNNSLPVQSNFVRIPAIPDFLFVSFMNEFLIKIISKFEFSYTENITENYHSSKTLK